MADAVLSSISKPTPTTPHQSAFVSYISDDAEDDISIDVGMPLGPTDSGVLFALATTLLLGNVVGLAGTASEKGGYGGRGHVFVVYAGPLRLTTAQWDRVTGQSGGLTPGQAYYLSGDTAGMLATSPDGFPVTTYVGFAIDAETMFIRIQPPTLTSP